LGANSNYLASILTHRRT